MGFYNQFPKFGAQKRSIIDHRVFFDPTYKNPNLYKRLLKNVSLPILSLVGSLGIFGIYVYELKLSDLKTPIDNE